MKSGKKERNVITGYLQGAGLFKRGIPMPDFNEYFYLDAKTGCLTFKRRDECRFANHKKASSWNSQNSGKVAGGVDFTTGYYFVRVMKKKYMAQDVIWMMMNGSIPEGKMVDHINHHRADNRPENLRLIDKNENAKNMRMNSKNKSGVCGVSFSKKRGKWVAQIKVNHKLIPLGRFDSFSDACKARKEAEKKYGFHDNHGKNL